MDQQCPDCGADLPANAMECPQCGQRLDDVTVVGQPSVQPAAPSHRPRKHRTRLYLLPGAALVVTGIGLMSFGNERLVATGGYVLIAGVLLWGIVRIFGPR